MKVLGYDIIKNIVLFSIKCFYRRFEVDGMEQLDNSKPMVYAPNHQNSLLDALNVLCPTPTRPYFVARADVFSVSKRITDILHFFRIYPVYRRHDGVENMRRAKNDETFEVLMDILVNNGAVGIFPEGTFAEQRTLYPLKKGIARFSFGAAQRSNYEKDILVFPMGIYYNNVDSFYEDVYVRFGEPIHLAEYYELYQEKPARAIKQFIGELSKRISPEMIDIQSKHYKAVELLRKLYREKMITHENLQRGRHPLRTEFLADKKTISVLQQYETSEPEQAGLYLQSVEKFEEAMDSLKLEPGTLQQPGFSFLNIIKFIITFPVFLFGFIFNIIPYYLCYKITFAILKDPQFTSTFKWASGFFIFPLFYIINFILLKLITGSWLWASLIILLVPFSGYFALSYIRDFKKQYKKYQFNQLLKTRKESIEPFLTQYSNIISKLDGLYKRYNSSN